LKDSYYSAWAGANVNAAMPALIGVFALRTSAALFGAGVSRQATYSQNGAVNPQSDWREWTLAEDEQTDAIYLDQLYAAIATPGYGVVSRLDGSEPASQVVRITQAVAAQRAAYGISGKSTRLRFDRDWWSANASTDMAVLRATLVRAQSERLTLVDEPIADDVSGHSIELGALYDELTSGRWVILSGERADIPGVNGVRAAELMMVSGLAHGFDATLPATRRTRRSSSRPHRLRLQARIARHLRQRRQVHPRRNAQRAARQRQRRRAVAGLHAQAAAADLRVGADGRRFAKHARGLCGRRLVARDGVARLARPEGRRLRQPHRRRRPHDGDLRQRRAWRPPADRRAERARGLPQRHGRAR
jgi:hypothetical protein